MTNVIKNKFSPENIAIFVFIAFFWIYWAYFAKNGVFNGFVIAAAVWGIYVLIRHFSVVVDYFQKSHFIYLFLLIWIPIVLSVFVSSEVKDTWRVVLNFIRFLFIGVLAIYLTQNALKTINKWVLILIVLVVVDALMEWLLGYHLLGKRTDPNRLRGLFDPGYQMGYYMATISPVILYRTFRSLSDKNPWRYIWVFLSLATALVIFLAGARAGWISLAASLGLLLLWALIQRKVSLKATVGVLLVTAIVVVGILQLPSVKNRYASPYFTEQAEFGSYEWLDKVSSNRLVLWGFSWSQFKEQPILGSGAGSFKAQFSAQPAELKNGHDVAFFPHLQGLEVLSETGLVGMIAYLAVLIWLFRLILISKQFPVWTTIAFLAIMPINMHVGLYTSFWALVSWASLILGVREHYLLSNNE